MKTWHDIAIEHQEAARWNANQALECRLLLLAGDRGPSGGYEDAEWYYAKAAAREYRLARLARRAMEIDDE